jgi:hypothetical protein
MVSSIRQHTQTDVEHFLATLAHEASLGNWSLSSMPQLDILPAGITSLLQLLLLHLGQHWTDNSNVSGPLSIGPLVPKLFRHLVWTEL